MSALSDTVTSTVVVDTRQSPGARLRPVAVSAVRLAGGLLAERAETSRTVSLPTQFDQIERTHRIDNFRRAAGKIDGDYVGVYFNDSDVYKWIEAAAWSLATTPDPELDARLDAVIAEIGDSQRPDGYLNSYFAVDRADERWTNPDLHETYCAGHLFQAAVAHYRATGKTSLLDIARRYADHICDTFGPEDQGRRFWIDGHEEVELALIELARATGEERYVEQAKYFIDARGHQRLPKPYGGRPKSYHQDHEPIRESSEVVGHAVRQLYFTSGATDLTLERPEPALDDALDRLWDNATDRKMYVTGGFGARWEMEAFGDDYELPNESAYAETCAAIAGAMWGWRLFLRTGEPRYLDVLERSLYNNVLAGLSRSGDHYFYQNPLEDNGDHRRSEWFGTACCPPNVARTLASLPGYLYATDDRGGIYVALYANSDATVERPGLEPVRISQQTAYPWDGTVTLTIGTTATFALNLRVPGWLSEPASFTVNGQNASVIAESSTFATIERDWAAGDTVELLLPMAVRRLVAHPKVTDDNGRVALGRGPLVYCVEAIDNAGRDVRNAILPADGAITEQWEPDLLGGVVTLSVPALFAGRDKNWDGGLYRAADEVTGGEDEQVDLTAIPYFAWANREAGPMGVWLRTTGA
ncbi:MAG: GH127 / GH146 [uncultured Thermomicrobiales bacterium]|uniref:GH127 / GH146 n=1 Tax=uncultured Thermomicrobiales bacterium TaxID=1645740 RepID=A0A6J4VEZ6_9BACT|nr:MAG: GH127 / GH146 [uncultured Thermomicrobiales bacterium]